MTVSAACYCHYCCYCLKKMVKYIILLMNQDLKVVWKVNYMQIDSYPVNLFDEWPEFNIILTVVPYLVGIKQHCGADCIPIGTCLVCPIIYQFMFKFLWEFSKLHHELVQPEQKLNFSENKFIFFLLIRLMTLAINNIMPTERLFFNSLSNVKIFRIEGQC